MIYYTNIYSILHTEKSDIIHKHGMTLIHSTLSIGYRESQSNTIRKHDTVGALSTTQSDMLPLLYKFIVTSSLRVGTSTRK